MIWIWFGINGGKRGSRESMAGLRRQRLVERWPAIASQLYSRPLASHALCLFSLCFGLAVVSSLTVCLGEINLIDQEREGEQIHRALLKNILDIFVEIGLENMDCYELDFEVYLLENAASHYSRKASIWILEDSCPDYMLKAEDCVKREKDRVGHYLHFSSENKLLEKVQNELFDVYASQLLEKEHYGCNALLRDDKTEDLSRMYRLFSKITKGLDPISQMFKQHVTCVLNISTRLRGF